MNPREHVRAAPAGARCAVHPTHPARGVCLRCGNFVCDLCEIDVNGVPYCPACFERLAPATGNIPWEGRAERGFFRALFRSWKGSLFRPGRFFSAMPVAGGFKDPLIYGVITYSIAIVISYAWNILFQMTPYLLGGKSVPTEGMVFIVGFGVVAMLFSPLISLLVLFFWGGLLHLCVLIVGGGNRGFEGTFRVVSYATAAQLWAVVPLLGSVVTFVWNLVITAIGIREAHDIPTGRAVLAVLLPILFFGALAFLLLVVAIAIPLLLRS